jgi:hypothetical protein
MINSDAIGVMSLIVIETTPATLSFLFSPGAAGSCAEMVTENPPRLSECRVTRGSRCNDGTRPMRIASHVTPTMQKAAVNRFAEHLDQA